MSTLKQLKDLNSKRREVLAKCLGAQSSEHLGVLLGRKAEDSFRTDNLSQLISPQAFGSSKTRLPDDDTKLMLKSKFPDAADDCPNATTKRKKHKSSSHRSSSSSSSRREESLHRTNSSNIGSTQDAFIVAKRSMDNLVDGPIPAAKRAKARAEKSGEIDEEVESFDDYFQALKEEEKVYKSSISFLKGTQSANPHNDYSQHFVDTGQRAQNFIRDIGLNERFDEYPKLKELIKLKDKLVSDTATPPMYLKTDLRNWDPQQEFGSRFDVIVIEPPLEEYFLHTSASRPDDQAWTWDQIEKLDIGSLADSRSFLWLWCGSSPEGLDRGRQCFKKWGFRRCEDICWVKRNCFSTSQGNKRPPDPSSLFQRTKEHCLMGIKGTVRRSSDGDFIHANVDIDLIITEETLDRSSSNMVDVNSSAATSSSLTHPFAKPLEIFLLAEHFCLGRRRIHLFGRDDTIRPGWVTAGPSLTSSNFDPRKYRRFFARENGGLTTGCTDRVENLRPKSPTPSSSGGGTSSSNLSASGGQQAQQSSNSSMMMGKNLTKMDIDRRQQTFSSRKMMRR